jgi:hypothetical protein
MSRNKKDSVEIKIHRIFSNRMEKINGTVYKRMDTI